MTDAPPRTGPEAVLHALKHLDLDSLGREARQVITDRKKTARPRAVRVIRILDGLRRNSLKPSDYMVHDVPVIPAAFRPFSVTGQTVEPGHANEGYRDLMEFNQVYKDTERTLGRPAAAGAYMDLQQAVAALYGHGESPNPKTQARKVKGFFDVISGTSPKTGFVQSKMLGKPMDAVGRAVIVPDADYGVNDVGLPRDMAWKMYGVLAQRGLVRSGMSPADATRHIARRSDQAERVLKQKMIDHPVVLTRSPAWHRFNTVGQTPHMVDGDAIVVNSYITAGLTADFDGDTASVHVPIQEDAVRDVKDKLMADKMLWSIKDPDVAMLSPKHESAYGLHHAATAAPGKTHYFPHKDAALQAIRSGAVDLNDNIEFGLQPSGFPTAAAGEIAQPSSHGAAPPGAADLLQGTRRAAGRKI